MQRRPSFRPHEWRRGKLFVTEQIEAIRNRARAHNDARVHDEQR
jgi:hypothetical protein